MTDEEPLGSVAEEAAKLFEALQGWARDGAGADAGAAAAGLGARFGDFEAHFATGAEECTWCPICRAVAMIRGTSPEVRTHLATAASSLLQAAAGILDARAQGAGRPRSEGVQKIDLDETDEWPDDGPGSGSDPTP